MQFLLSKPPVQDRPVRRQRWLTTFLFGLVAGLIVLGLFGQAMAQNDRNTRKIRAKQALKQLKAENPGLRTYKQNGKITRLYGRPFGRGNSVEHAADKFLKDYGHALEVEYRELKKGGKLFKGRHIQPVMYNKATGDYKFKLVYYTQHVQNVPVYDADVRILVTNDNDHKVVWANNGLKNMGDYKLPPGARSLDAQQIAESFTDPYFPNPDYVKDARMVVYAGTDDAPTDPTLAVEFKSGHDGPYGAANGYLLDAYTGDIILKADLWRNFDVSGEVSGAYTDSYASSYCDQTMDSVVLKYARVTAGDSVTYTDSTGAYSITGLDAAETTVTAYLWGEHFRVYNNSGDDATLTATVTPTATQDFYFDPSSTSYEYRAQVDAYVNANKVRDFVKSVNPDLPGLDTDLITIGVNSSDKIGNASYMYNVITLGIQDSVNDTAYANTAFSTIIYHEYGHHIAYNVLNDLGTSGYEEGMCDAVAMLVSSDSLIGTGYIHTDDDCNTYLRNLSPDSTFPDQVSQMVLAGSIWDLMDTLRCDDQSGYISTAADLTLNSLLLHRGTGVSPQIAIDFLTLDDDDYDLETASTHSEHIKRSFGLHDLYQESGVVRWVDSASGDDLTGDGSAGAPYKTIAQGITEAWENWGDTVMVGPGTYSEQIELDEPIVLMSSNGPLVTSIAAVAASDTLLSWHSADMGCVISGFTFRGGSFGVLDRLGATGTISNNIFIDQDSCAIRVGYSNSSGVPRIANNTIRNGNNGIEIWTLLRNAIISNNIVANNDGYAVYVDNSPASDEDYPDLLYNNVWNNGTNYGPGLSAGTGSISTDPLFESDTASLASNSPCIDTGDPDGWYNDPDGSRNDMGAVPLCSVYVDISSESLSIVLRDSALRRLRPYGVGDTVVANVAVDIDYSIQPEIVGFELLSPETGVTLIDPYDFALDPDTGIVNLDSLIFCIPTTVDPITGYDLELVVTADGAVADTISLGEFFPMPYAAKMFTTENPSGAPDSLPDYWSHFVNYGNTDDDAAVEAAFYFNDSVYVMDMSTKSVESGYPILASAADLIEDPPGRVVAPSLGDLEDNGEDEVIYVGYTGSRYHWVCADGSGSQYPFSPSQYHYCKVTPVFVRSDPWYPSRIAALTDGFIDSLVIYRKIKSGAVSKYFGWPLNEADSVRFGILTIGDLDNNGADDIVVASDNASSWNLKIYDARYGGSGNVYTTSAVDGNTSKIGDINGDGRNELLVPAGSGDGDAALMGLAVIAWDTDSASYRILDTLYYASGGADYGFVGTNVHGFQDNFVLADVDDDGFPNVVAINVDDTLDVTNIFYFDNDLASQELVTENELAALFPNSSTDSLDTYATNLFTQLIVGNLNGDSDLDILISHDKAAGFTLGVDDQGDPLFGVGDDWTSVFGVQSVDDGDDSFTLRSYGTPSIIPAGSKTYLAQYHYAYENTPYGDDTTSNQTVLTFYEFDETNSADQWNTYRGDQSLGGCYRRQIGGTLEMNTILSRLDTTLLVGDLVIPSGITLMIPMGVTILAAADDATNLGSDANRCEIIVNGTLDVNGGAFADWRVTFASVDGAAGDWYGIEVDSGSVSIRYADIKDAVYGVHDVGSESDTVFDCDITNCLTSGIYTSNSSLSVLDCTIEGYSSTGYGMHVDDADGIIIKDNDFSGGHTSLYLQNSQANVRDCDFTGADTYGLKSSATDADSLDAVSLINLDFTGDYATIMYLQGGDIEMDSCSLVYPNPSDRDYCLEANGCNHLTMRRCFARYAESATIYATSCDYDGWDLGQDVSGENGNNTIYWALIPPSNVEYCIAGSGNSGDLLAEKNYWGATTGLSGLFSIGSSGGSIDYDPYLTSDPHAKVQIDEGNNPLIPDSYALGQNYPNPFNPTTHIYFDLPEANSVQLDVFNILGQRVTSLANGEFPAGRHHLVWEGTNGQGNRVATGIYFYRIVAGDFVMSKKMLLLK